jgi:hypothetical protein
VAGAAAAPRNPSSDVRAIRILAAAGIILGASCAGPSAPTNVGPATSPIVRSIKVPSTRVEAGTDVTITAVVDDAETPLSALTFQWSASAGTITGSGTTATWRMPPGITSGIDVVIGLTVFDSHDAVVNNFVVKQQFVATAISSPFRVHDSVAEVKELARKFLVDLFGNSSVPAEACVVDFADVCANFGEGKTNELQQIIAHRAGYVVISAQVLNQKVVFTTPDTGSVHSATMFVDRLKTSKVRGTTCGDFEVTVIYVGGRWWICESYFNEGDTSFCPTASNDGGVARVLRKRAGS